MEGDTGSILGGEYDSSQTGMMDEECILIDGDDNPIGPGSKVLCHLGEGRLHRAFSVLLFDSEGRLLIQKRAGSKITFPGVWANTCCSHPLHTPEELEDGVGVKRAAIRKLGQELGISREQVAVDDFQLISRLHYQARADERWVEHEIDHVLVIRADVDIDVNPNEVEEIRWVTADELADMIAGTPDNGTSFAPWFVEIAERFLPSCWGNQDDLADDGLIHHVGLLDSAGAASGEGALLEALVVHRDRVEQSIDEALAKTMHARLRTAMQHLFKGGGKRLRAILPWLVADAAGEAHQGLYDLGAAIEIIHNFTLIHDDIMDNDAFRRGRPAVHVEFDNPTAINAGDAMLALSFEVLSESEAISDDHFRRLVQIIGSMVRRVSEGQQMDMDFENQDDVSEDAYMRMIAGKTAAMFKACSECGAMLSGADDETVIAMAEWGMQLGLCFQLMDDLIDVTGDSETLGKPAGSDILEGKRTLIAIHALQQDLNSLPVFQELYGSYSDEESDARMKQALAELRAAGSIDHALARAMHHHSRAHELLNRIPVSEARDLLRELTDWQLVRIS
jgi:isopentenyl-diphosphate delta-isomerase type 1